MYGGFFLKNKYTTCKILQRIQNSKLIKSRTINRIDKRLRENERQRKLEIFVKREREKLERELKRRESVQRKYYLNKNKNMSLLKFSLNAIIERIHENWREMNRTNGKMVCCLTKNSFNFEKINQLEVPSFLIAVQEAGFL